MGDDMDRDTALTVLRRDYYQDVRGVAEEMRERILSGEIGSPEALHDAVNESVDGHQRVIYPALAREAIVLSDNRDAYEEYGTIADLPPATWAEVMAHTAMRQDVVECMASVLEMDPGDPDTYRPIVGRDVSPSHDAPAAVCVDHMGGREGTPLRTGDEWGTDSAADHERGGPRCVVCGATIGGLDLE